MSVLPTKSALHWKAAFLLGAVTFFSSIYFYEGGGWNQNSRFDLLRAIVEQHTLRIDSYHDNTEDEAHFQGHYYSDKAPGLVFFAVPFAMGARTALRIVGVDPESNRGELALSYLAAACAAALPAALAGMCLFFMGLRFGASPAGAGLGALVMCVGTPMWAYAGLFWAHALVGACVIFAFACTLKLGESSGGGADFGWGLAVGLAAGWATVTEYPAAPVSVMLAFLALSQVWKRGAPARWRAILGVGVGAGICLAVLAGYLYASFGSIRPSYAYYDPNAFSFMRQQGYMGLTYPHPDRLLKLLFGCSRGLLFASPVLIAAPWGLWRLWKERPHRPAALVGAAIVAYYFLFSASFYWWKAGLTFGPRYAGASIPLLCIGLVVAWEHASDAWRRALMALAVCGVFLALIVISTTSQLSMQDSCPIVHSTWGAFWSGQMAVNRVSMLTVKEAGSTGAYGAFNLGQLSGLHGLASLIPLLMGWGVAAVMWWRMGCGRREDR